MPDDREQVFTLIRDRFGALDKRLDDQDGQLRRILGEARRTNGRVTALEGKLTLVEAIQDHDERRITRVRMRREFVLGSLCIVAGGSLDFLLRFVFG